MLAAATLDEPHRWNCAERSMRDGLGGGRCGGAAPAQGRAEGPTAQNCSGQWSETARLKIGVKKSEERVAFARLSQGRELFVAGTFGIFLGRLKGRNRTTR